GGRLPGARDQAHRGARDGPRGAPDLAHQVVDHPLERVEAERLRDRGPQVRVRVDVVEHQLAVGGLEVLDAADVELPRGHDALAPGDGLRRYFFVRIKLDRQCRFFHSNFNFTGASFAAFRVAHRSGTEIEPPMRNDAHGVKELAAEKLHAYDAARGVGGKVFLEQ